MIHEKLRERKEYAKRNVSLEDLAERGEAPFFGRERVFIAELFESENDLDDEDIVRIKEEILGELPPGDRELIELFYEQKLSLGEIAERLGRSKDAVRVKLSRLTDKVTESVRRYFEEE